MIESLINLFTFGGNSTLMSGGTILPSLTSSTCIDSFNDNPELCSSLLTSASVSSALINNANATNLESQSEDVQMIVESMSIEELQELKYLLDEKESTLTMHK